MTSYHTEAYTTDGLYGLVQGCMIGQQDRIDELNTRTYERFLPTSVTDDVSRIWSPKPPLYPISTKYELMPTRDHRALPKKRYGCGPWFGTYVDTESNLLNKDYRYGSEAHVFIPSYDHSDLYRTHIAKSSTVGNQQYPLLFERQSFAGTHNPYATPVNKTVFWNNTRLDIKQ